MEDSLLAALMCHSSITIAAIHQLFSEQAYLLREDPLVGTMMYSANITIFNESNQKEIQHMLFKQIGIKFLAKLKY